MKNTYLYYILLLYLFTSCVQRDATFFLQNAETFWLTNPDSCRFYLQQIRNPKRLPSVDYTKYQLFRQVNERQNGNRQRPDSLFLTYARDLIQAKDSNLAAQCYLWRGIILQRDRQYVETEAMFRKGLQIASNPETRSVLYRYLGISFWEQNKPDVALLINREAMRLYDQVGLPTQINLLNDVAYSLSCLNQPDSALYYYRAAIRESEKDSLKAALYQAFFYDKVSWVYQKAGKTEEALEALKKGLQMQRSRQDIPYSLLAEARIFLSAGEIDSARVYLKKAIQTPDTYVATYAYQLQAEIQEAYSPAEALDSWRKYQRSIRENATNQIAYSITAQKYQDEKLRSENAELRLKKKQQDIYLLSLCLIFITLTTCGYIWYMRERKKKIQQEVTRLKQERELIRLQERATALREQLFRHLSASNKLSSLSNGGKNAEEKSRLTNEEIEELIQTVDSIWPGFAERLRTQYPLLRAKDISFCCLIKSGITTKDLATIYYVTPSAISQKKARMKREKFGIMDEKLSLDDFLKNF